MELSLLHVTPTYQLLERAQALKQGKGADNRDRLEMGEKAGHRQGSLSSRRLGLPFAPQWTHPPELYTPGEGRQDVGTGSQVTGPVTLGMFSRQISQVCQLCQQSPRLFSNHAAQLHTLLVSMQDCLPQPHSSE